MRLASRDNANFIGSETAAQDLYGIGVRVGLYLQGAGMILCMMRSRSSGAGVKLASGSITISILASWTVLANKMDFSPCEAYLVLFLLSAMLAPGKMVLFNVNSLVGEGLGLFAIFITELWMCAAHGWLFARLCITLPALGTENVTFFFARVPLNGWFRILMLVLCVVFDWPTTIWWIFKIISALRVSMAVYRRGAAQMTESEKKKANIYDILSPLHNVISNFALPESDIKEIWEWAINFQKRSKLRLKLGLPIFLWAFAVTTVETTIIWNHLSPSKDLASPGQLIPFITGICVFVDGTLVLFRPRSNDSLEGGPENSQHRIV